LGFLQELGALEKEIISNKRLEGGGKEGKETNSRVEIKDVGEGRCPHSILERSKAWVGHGIFLGSSMTSIRSILIEVDNMTLDIQEFHSLQQEH
jgi:hypothetical protein